MKPLPHAAHYPHPPAGLHQGRGWLLKALGRSYLRWLGWRIEGAWPEVPKYVAIVAPHTSNWDFPLGLAVAFAVELRVSWLGKHTLFRPPFKAGLTWLGGIPVNRNAAHGVVGDCVKAFKAAPALMLVVTPEGTRKGVSRWKSGFYFMATQAGVPIMPIGFDFREQVVHLMPLFWPSGNLEQDLPLIQACFNQMHGCRERPAKD
jgi:1-acyl-sn-glycerol-3-phosphate acyltransferase